MGKDDEDAKDGQGEVTEMHADVKSTDIIQLQLALKKSLQREGQLQDELISRKASSEQIPEPCYFLKKLPIEMRNRVYTLLLVNKDLAFADRNQGDLPSRKFHLAPSFLTTCRQIYEEGSSVLYDSNTFFVECQSQDSIKSPLMRRTKQNLFSQNEKSDAEAVITNSPWIRRVRKWNITVDPLVDYPHTCPPSSLVFFCRAICDNEIKSLNVLIAPKYDEPRPRWSGEGGEYFKLTKVLTPLRMLRGVGTIKLSAGDNENQLSSHYSKWKNCDSTLITAHEIEAGLEQELQSTMEGNSPIVHVWKMYNILASYVQAFEVDESRRDKMLPALGDAKSRLQDRSEGSDSDIENPHRRNQFPRRAVIQRPSKMDQPYHPIEKAIDRTSYASEINDLERFVAARSDLLEYLEPQYQRLAAASLSVAEFVKWDKRRYEKGIYCRTGGKNFFSEALICAEDYSHAFSRDIPRELRINNRAGQSREERLLLLRPRNRMLKQMELILENPGLWETFIELFKKVVDDMDTQFLKIRKARKALFSFDVSDPGCNIDLEKTKCDEMIDWDAPSPKITVPEKPKEKEVAE